MNHLKLFKKTSFLVLLALFVICQENLRNTAVTTVTPYSTYANLVLDPTNFDVATYFFMDPKVHQTTYGLKNAFTVHIRLGTVPENYTFNAKVVQVNKKMKDQELIAALSAGIPVSGSEITFTTQKRNRKTEVFYHYFDNATINTNKDNYIVVYLKFPSQLTAKLTPPSTIINVDKTCQKILFNSFYAPLFIKLTVPDNYKAFLVIERNNYYIHPTEIQANPSPETNLSQEIAKGVYFIEFNIPGDYIGVPSFIVDINIIESGSNLIPVSDKRRTSSTIVISCSSNSQSYYQDIFDMNDKDKAYEALTNPIGIVIEEINAEFKLKFNSDNEITIGIESSKTNPLRVLSTTNQYIMKATCTNGSLKLKYTYDYIYGIEFTDFYKKTPMITNKEYELIFSGCRRNTNIEFDLENPENNSIQIKNTQPNRLLEYGIREQWTLNEKTPKIQFKTIFSRFIIKAEKPAYLNMIFAKNDQFTVILTGSGRINKQSFLYKFTDSTIKSYKIKVTTTTPRRELRYAVDKGAPGYTPFPLEIFNNSIAYVKNPLLNYNNLASTEFYYIAVFAYPEWPEASADMEFTIIPTPKNELHLVDLPGKSGSMNGIAVCNPYCSEFISDIPEEGPNLTALWVIMGLAGATALVIGGWFIYNCLLEKGFFNKSMSFKSAQPTSNKVSVISEKTVQSVNKTNTNSITTKQTNPIHAKYTPVTSTSRTQNTFKKK